MASVISFRIDDEDRELLQKIADEFDATISWAARRAIKQYLANIAKESEENENGDCVFPQSDGTLSQDGVSTYRYITES